MQTLTYQIPDQLTLEIVHLNSGKWRNMHHWKLELGKGSVKGALFQ